MILSRTKNQTVLEQLSATLAQAAQEEHDLVESIEAQQAQLETSRANAAQTQRIVATLGGVLETEV